MRLFTMLWCKLYNNVLYIYLLFFFQAEDGIRDLTVTGVQTCALPISFQVFGRYQGNFYAAIIYAVNKLLHGEEKPTGLPAKQDTIPRFRGFIIPPIDTVADSTHRRTHP